MDGGDYFGVNDGQTRVIPGQKSACRKFHHIRNDKRADGQETQEWLTLLPRLEGGRCNGAKGKSETEADPQNHLEAPRS